ncbi:MAG: proline--tRNA ligase, partial [Coriobacteriia bacterium]|nr:proline--tRNA ligase [Coriobacteriia bacterium]
PPRMPRDAEPLERVATPEARTIAEVAAFFGVDAADTVKTMAAVTGDGRLVLLCVPGHRELNPLKADRATGGVGLLEEAEFEARQLPKGSLGPVGAPEGVLILADRSLQDMSAWIVGANVDGYHFTGASPLRDFAVDEWVDLVVAAPGDRCPECDGTLEAARGIEVSQVFQLGTKYSVAMKASFTDESGAEQPFIMGCYGIGITRSLAAVIEQHNDQAGIAWPMSVAPLEVAVLPLAVDDETVFPVAERLWRELADAGIEVVIDDRNERAGVKFADADLIGWPYQLVVGSRGLAEGAIELKERATGERTSVPLEQAVALVSARVEAERRRYA